jgi:endoglucanase
MELLKKLCETDGIAGTEDAIRDLVRTSLEPLCDEVRIDALGNVIGHKVAAAPVEGAHRSVMLAAHMDEIGFLVTHVDEEKGFVRLNPVGGFDPRTLVAQRVTVHTDSGRLRGVLGTKPIHVMTDEEKARKPDLKLFYVDLGLPAKTVVEKVQAGDMVTLERDFANIGDGVTGKALDDRTGVYVMIEAMRKVAGEALGVDVFAVATVQEEVGVRGAQTSAFGVEPDLAIVLDVTVASDVPDAKSHEYVTVLGEGAAIKLMDGSLIADRAMVRALRRLAQEKGIPHQLEILPRGGTDGGAIQRSRAGVRTAGISIPTRYLHSTVEMAYTSDLRAAVDLLAEFLRIAHQVG